MKTILKRTAIVLGMVLFTLASFAQHSVTFVSNSFQPIMYNESISDWEWGDTVDRDFTITISEDNVIVRDNTNTIVLDVFITEGKITKDNECNIYSFRVLNEPYSIIQVLLNHDVSSGYGMLWISDRSKNRGLVLNLTRLVGTKQELIRGLE